MSNASALLHGRNVDISDSIYLEREDERESKVEEYLHALMASLPNLKSHKSRVQRFILRVNHHEAEMQLRDDPGLVAVLKANCLQMRRQGFADELVAQAFAAIREASLCTLGMRHHDVQLMGGWTLLQGMLAEMQTGEGKTLVATLAACTAATTGATVHVVTVNDYLAARDARENTPLYHFFGLTVGVIAQDMVPEQRQIQYDCDVVYVSNKEIVFDYLKDRLATEGASASRYRVRNLYRPEQPPRLLLRGLHMAIVDEADSVLIDEARTPLIISATQPDEHGIELYKTAIEGAGCLERGVDFEITEHKEVWITPDGEQHLHDLTAGLSGVWQSSLWRRELFEKAISALWCFFRDQHYIVADGKVQIVDESTGRVMPDRSWERGLHQMIEAKEGCEITGARKTLSRMTYQRFFKRYLLLCGMTGTASEITTELRRVYDLPVHTIPTHQPSKRTYLGASCWFTSERRWEAVALRSLELSRVGRSVLIGTRSVEASDQLSTVLASLDIVHTVLNARQDGEEAEVVGHAGQPGRITVATNMAGRGTDIKLTKEVSALGGLHVILTEYHESARIDRQLFGRCARQGEPGTVEAIVCLEDELFKRFSPVMWYIATRMSGSAGRLPSWILFLLARHAQSMAERYNAGIRRRTLKQDRKMLSLLGFSGAPN